MRNHKHRDVRYRGYIIRLEYDLRACGWAYTLTNEESQMDCGSGLSRLSFGETLHEARGMVDDLITENEEYQQTVFGGDEDGQGPGD